VFPLACGVPDGAWYEAWSVDISRSGILVSVAGREWSRLAATGDVLAIFTKLEVEFPDGVELSLCHGSIVRRARIVRVSVANDGGPHLRIGCEFSDDLTDAECALIEIGSTSPDDAGPAADGPPPGPPPTRRR
jgi:hypothetical protein